MRIRPATAAGAASAAAALAVCVALPGCSLGADEEPKQVGGAVKEVARVVTELERATRAQDWSTVCDDLFTASAVERAGGRDCARLLRETAGDVHGADIRLLAIELDGERARATVRTRAAGQAPLEDDIVLQRERDEWRIESLAAG